MLVRLVAGTALVVSLLGASVARGQTLALPGALTPSAPGASQLYEAARGHAASLPAKSLVCRVEVKGRYDTLLPSQADLRVGLSVGERPAVVVDGPEDSDVVFLTFPVTLAAGDPLHFSVWDRDLFEVEVVGAFETTAGRALPVGFEDSLVSIACTAVTDAQVTAGLDASLAQLDEAVNLLAQLPTPRLREDGLGLGERLANVTRALYAAAAWQGWNSEAMKARLARAQALERTWTQRVGQVVLAERGDGSFVGEVTCAPATCRVVVPVAADAVTPSAQLLLSSGQLVVLHREPSADQPGKVAFDTWRVDDWVQGTPRLLRLQKGGSWDLVRLPDGLTALSGGATGSDTGWSDSQKLLFGLGVGTAALGVGAGLGAWLDRDGAFGRVCAITAGTLGMAALGAGLGALLFGQLDHRDEFIVQVAMSVGAIIGGAAGGVLGAVGSAFLSGPPGVQRGALGVAGGGVMVVVPLTVLLLALR